MNKENYAPWQITPLKKEQFSDLDNYEKLLYLCRLAELAPSTHNTQPWRFFIDSKKNCINIFVDRSKILPASDIAGNQALVSIGCALENMFIGALFLWGRGNICMPMVMKKALIPDKRYTPENRYLYLAQLDCSIQSKNVGDEDVYKSIFTRKVLRAEYDPLHPLPSEVIGKINKATDNKNTKLHIITDAIRRFSIAEFQSQADGFVINSPRFSHELGEWLLPNDTSSSLGMPGVGFGLNDAEAKRIHEGLRGISSLQPEDGLKFALGGKIGMEKSPFIACITIPKDTTSGWMNAGRAFEHIFLILESYGISVAVHAGIIEVPLINRIFAASLGTFRKPAVLFRAGYAKNPKDCQRPHSPRMSIEELLLSSDH